MNLRCTIVLLAVVAFQSVFVHGQGEKLLETLNKTGGYNTLLTAIYAADLARALSSTDPFTIFAPNDDAFNKLPAETLADLLKPENKEKLANLLNYHVLGGNVTSADIKAKNLPTQIETLVPIKLIADLSGSAVKINNALVTNPDIGASNGIIHGVDTVIFIPTDVVQTLTNDSVHRFFVDFINAAGLAATLKSGGPYTVYAPIELAFSMLPTGVYEDLLQPGNQLTLAKIVRHHVTQQIQTASSIDHMALPVNITMLSGFPARLNKNTNDVTIDGATIFRTDIFNTNGMIHSIDSLIFPPFDLVDTAVTNGKFRNLTTALIATNLTVALRGDGPFTVFAPTDDAFAKLPAGTLENLLKPENLDQLKEILSYHVLGERKSSADIKAMDLPAQLTTLSGLKPIVDRNGETILLNNAVVATADVATTNGLIHIIDTVLLPLPDIVQTAINTSQLTVLAQAIESADLNATLRGDGPFTVFGPTNDAFGRLPAGVLTELLLPENKNTLAKIVKHHGTNGLITSASINRKSLPVDLTMLSGGTAKLDKVGNTVKIGDASVTTADIYNANGMVHIVDRVLLPQLNVVETAILNGNFQKLILALKKADLFATLQGDGPFTVFAPSDAAFDKLPAGTLDDLLKPENKPKLITFLQYHVVNGRKTSGDIKGMTLPGQLTTLSNTKFVVDVDGDQVKVNDAKVVQADIGSTNGIVHVVDTVILPTGDIVQTVLGKGNFKTLVDLLIAADLSNKLKGDGPFTVLAPTDEAFNALPANLVADLRQVENKATLTKVLSYHVTSDLITLPSLNRKQLPFNQTMSAGGVTKIDKQGNTVKVNDATVQQLDIFNSNGMLQIINKVLIPLFDVFETALLNGNVRTLVKALRLAELDGTLQGDGPFTVFAPNDAAFAKLPNDTLADLLKPENKAKLTRTLKYHVISGRKITSDELTPSQLDMLDGGSVTITKDGADIKINGNKVVTKNLESSNGIIHILDGVLIPAETSGVSRHTSQTMLIALLSMFITVYRFFF